MEDLLPITWYAETPIDFEHKEYIIYAYLQKVDNQFKNKNLSPHLLHMEKLIVEMNLFINSLNTIKKDFNKNRYVYFDNVKLEGENDRLISEITEIVEFALPQFKPRVDLGYKILKRNKQILY